MPEPMLTASVMFANAARFADAYHTAIAPLCCVAETGLPPGGGYLCCFWRIIPAARRRGRSAGCAD